MLSWIEHEKKFNSLGAWNRFSNIFAHCTHAFFADLLTDGESIWHRSFSFSNYVSELYALLHVVVVVLLFYVHCKHLRSCRDGQLTWPHFSWAGLDLLSGWPVLRAHTFASNWQQPFLKKRKEKRKYVARPGIEPRTPDLRVRCPTNCATRPGLCSKWLWQLIRYYGIRVTALCPMAV